MKRDIPGTDEEGIKIKEQAISELGSLFAKMGQADGTICICFFFKYCHLPIIY